MKTLDVSRTLKIPRGDEIKDPTGRVVTIADIILDCLGRHQFKDKRRSVRAWKMSMKLIDASQPVDFEDADFDMIKEALEDMQSGAIVQGQVWLAVEEAEEEAK